jgi:hypothetical protein
MPSPQTTANVGAGVGAGVGAAVPTPEQISGHAFVTIAPKTSRLQLALTNGATPHTIASGPGVGAGVGEGVGECVGAGVGAGDGAVAVAFESGMHPKQRCGQVSATNDPTIEFVHKTLVYPLH